MPPRPRLVWILLAGALLIEVNPLGAQPPKVATDRPRTADAGGDALEQALTKLGYVGVALERTKYGHLIANVQVEGTDRKHDLRMVVDSGSSVTLITPAAAKALGLAVEKTGGTVGGVGGTGIAVSTTRTKTLKIGGHEEKEASLAVIDIGHVNTQFEAFGLKAVDGVIGSDWMLAKKGLIDVASARLFILPPKAK